MSIYIHAMQCIINCSVIKMHYLLVINLSWFWVPCTVLLFLISFSESILCFFKIWLTLRETQWHQKQIKRGGYGLDLSWHIDILTSQKRGGVWLCLTLQKYGGGLSPLPPALKVPTPLKLKSVNMIVICFCMCNFYLLFSHKICIPIFTM